MIRAEGPLLTRLLEAQAEADRAVAFPAIEGFAARLVKVIEQLDSPLLWPVDPAAHQLAGAATLVGRGRVRVRVRPQGSSVETDRVLVLAGVAVSPLTILDAAIQARRFGAEEVFAAAIRIDGSDHELVGGAIDRYVTLAPVPDRRLALATPG
jgi:hypothetical protein